MLFRNSYRGKPFKVEISAVADAPTLKDESEIPSIRLQKKQDYIPPTIEITGIEDDGIRIYNIPVMHYRVRSYSSRRTGFYLGKHLKLGNDILTRGSFWNKISGRAVTSSSLEEAVSAE